MKELIQDRLNRITNLSERRMLKNILFDVFENVVDYNMEMYDRLEKRIFDEISDPLDKFYIYSCLDLANNVDPISDFFHPILKSDLDDMLFNMDEIKEKLQYNKEIILTSIFMKCDYLTFKEILGQQRSFKGTVKTDKAVYEVKVSLKHCKKYIYEIEKLYRIFQFNGVTWNTVNCPYAYKFADVILNSTLSFGPGEKITEISVDLSEYEKYKVLNVIPLWNISRIEVQDKSFPMPSGDRINYEHKVLLGEYGIQNGYMVGLDNADFIYCKRQAHDLVIISPHSDQHQWNLIQIENVENLTQKNYSYEIMSNKRDLGFIGRYSSLKSVVIRTKGEIARLIRSYDLSKELFFQNVEIQDNYTKEEETTDYNNFVDDNIRINAYKKIMLIKFAAEDREDFLIQDKMSFLLSEMQILFPEYKCIGELL